MAVIHLQGIGNHQAIKAEDLRVGDITVWNYGSTEEIVNISKSKSGKSVKATIKAESGNLYSRIMRSERLVGIEKRTMKPKTTAAKSVSKQTPKKATAKKSTKRK